MDVTYVPTKPEVIAVKSVHIMPPILKVVLLKSKFV